MGNDIQQIDKNFAVEAAVRCDGMSFYDVKNSPFSVYGLYDYKNQMPYKRMPDEIGKNVNEGVARLYTNTSGGRIRFSTDSDLIILKAELLSVGRMPHFPITGTCGFDIYEDFPELDSSRYLATFIPPYDVTDRFESKVTLSGRKKRYFTIHFPLYSSVSDVLIGVRDDATLEQGREYKNILPIVYYGNSVTQGGCASRPGNSFPAIIGRRLNIDFVNLGFSGAGRAEDIMTDYLAGLEMGVFVSDYDHNAPNVDYLKETHLKMFKKIREAHPTLPIILMTRCDFSYNEAESVKRRDVIYETYRYARSQKDKNVYFMDGGSVYNSDYVNIAVVDRIHPNDLGFTLIAETLEGIIKKALQNGTN